MCLDELIEDLMTKEGVDRKKVIRLLSDGIKHKKDECDICEDIYCECYDYLTDDLCEELISNMSNEDHTGSIWTLDETNNVAKKLDISFDTKPYTPEEFRAAMTMEYYEHYTPLKKSGVGLEGTGWGRLADYSLTKDPDKMITYYFCNC